MAENSINPKIKTLSDADIAVLKEIIRDVNVLRSNSQVKGHQPTSHQASDVYVALPSNPIPALVPQSGTATGDMAGSMSCSIYQIDPATGELGSTGREEIVYNLTKQIIASNWIVITKDKFGRWVIPASDSTSSGGGSCGCCDVFNCITAIQAVVSTCAATPNGAPYQFTFNMGTSVSYPALYGNQTFTWEAAVGCSGTASGYSPGGSLTCYWFACPFHLTEIGSGTGHPTGEFQWVFNATDQSIKLYFLSGTNWLGAFT